MLPSLRKPAPRSPVARPRTGETPVQNTRIDQDDWDDLKAVVGIRRRAQIVRDLIRWYLRRPGATLPERPTREQMTEITRRRLLGE